MPSGADSGRSARFLAPHERSVVCFTAVCIGAEAERAAATHGLNGAATCGCGSIGSAHSRFRKNSPSTGSRSPSTAREDCEAGRQMNKSGTRLVRGPSHVRQNMLRSLLFSTFISGSAFAATWDQLPFAGGVHDIDPKVVEQGVGRSHPWQPGDTLPANFKDAGLTPPVKLVACDIYLDGGSRFYIFRGANDKFLMFCTDSGLSYSAETKKTSPVAKPKLYLAASHSSSKRKMEIPVGSATEQFLLDAIKSEVERITASRKK